MMIQDIDFKWMPLTSRYSCSYDYCIVPPVVALMNEYKTKRAGRSVNQLLCRTHFGQLMQGNL